MTSYRLALALLVCITAVVTTASPAFAFCDVLRSSARGATQQQALRRANNRGLLEVRQLNRRYGSRIRYERAAFRCTGGNNVRCTITQRYCVNERRRRRARPDECPGDSVRNARGQCVKENEPEARNPCSGGRLFSQSREICHCPENRPVWTGRRCISARPVAGPSNRQIRERCSRLERECRAYKLRGACRGLQQYCDRG